MSYSILLNHVNIRNYSVKGDQTWVECDKRPEALRQQLCYNSWGSAPAGRSQAPSAKAEIQTKSTGRAFYKVSG